MAASVRGSIAADVAGGKEHPLVPLRFTGSTMEAHREIAFDAYDLYVAAFSRGKPTRSEHLEGKITRIRYRVPKGSSTLQVLRNYETELAKAGFTTLFSCAGRECGDRELGYHVVDRAQATGAMLFRGDERYVAARRTHPDGDAYVSLFLAEDTSGGDAKRGTIGVLLDVIETKPLAQTMEQIDAAAMAKDIETTGRVALYGIYFDFDKADVKAESEPALAEIAKLLASDANLKLYVIGHTDNQGTAAYNVGLSQRRAQAVVAALVSLHKVAPERLAPAGVGPYAPVAPNATDAGRAKNRRVELVPQ